MQNIDSTSNLVQKCHICTLFVKTEHIFTHIFADGTGSHIVQASNNMNTVLREVVPPVDSFNTGLMLTLCTSEEASSKDVNLSSKT